MIDGSLRVVSIADEAINYPLPAGLLGKYVEKRELALIEPYFKPGVKPTLYFVKPISHAIFKSVLELPTETARAYASFQAGVVRIENVRGERGETSTLETATVSRMKKEETLSDEQLELFDPSELLEIGEVAFTRSFFRKRTERIYRLPRVLRATWVDLVGHLAVQRQEAEQEEQEEQAEEPTTDTTQTAA